MTATVVYPRGFIGFDIGLPADNRSMDLTKLLQAVRHNQTIVRPSKPVISNGEIENLWKQYKTGDRFIKSFAFREKILIAAMQAMGTKSFLEWCLLQNSNPYFTEMHKRFMNDTFNFIETGKRSVNVLSWMNLVVAKQANSKDQEMVFQYPKFFGLQQPIQYRNDQKFISTLAKWTSQPNGFDDLVGTMHIFFGDKELC
jgi:hypothetical protein